MGYQTTYSLSVENDSDPDVSLSVRDAVCEASGYSIAMWSDMYLPCVKWYEWETDMKSVSLEFPNKLIKLTGEGENAGDLWHAYFKDGKCQVCEAEVVYPPFDESKLK